MSCCVDPRAGLTVAMGTLPADLAEAVVEGPEGFRLTFYVPDIHCAACIGRIEDACAGLGADVAARVNLTRRTVTLLWRAAAFDPGRALALLRDLGYAPRPLAAGEVVRDDAGAALLRALAVAGFAAMNVMLLSVSVWSGADGSTRAFLNWFAALIALPALTYAARPFVRSALAAVRRRRLNMDVPISLAIVLAAALSLAKTVAGEGETYFDAAIALTFFLLLGRVLDHLMRERARTAVGRLAALRAPYAHVIQADGTTRPEPVESVPAGACMELAAGERVPLDARLRGGSARFDLSLATGESRPVDLAAGQEVVAGALALDGPVTLEALRPATQSYLAQLAVLQAAAEEARSRPARLADRAARIYAPVVHLVALVTFAGWLVSGAGVAAALTVAIAVLIITCPCALGLAVPAVQVAACDRLFRAGIALKDGGALERLRQIDEVVFDKTGTLTVPALDPSAPMPATALAAAAALARHSTHPLSRAVVRGAEQAHLALPRVAGVAEHRGRGVSGTIDGRRVFLGRGTPPWLAQEVRGGAEAEAGAAAADGLVFHCAGEPAVPVHTLERPREGAEALVRALSAAGLPVTMLTGDGAGAAAAVASRLGIDHWRAGCTPADKLSFLRARAAAGARTLMVGDGLNDGPALAAAHASIAPADASDLSRTAADVVLTDDRLTGVATALQVARRAHRLILQNFAVAVSYNLVAIPLAVAGHASPLVAALAMSTSSILVTANALRLLPGRRAGSAGRTAPTALAAPLARWAATSRGVDAARG